MNSFARAALVLIAFTHLARAQQGAFGASEPSQPEAGKTTTSTAAPAAVAAPTDIFSVTPVEGGLTPSAAPALPSKPSPVAYRPGMGALIDSLSAENTDFNFKDAEVLGILRTFAVRFNKNIIAAPGVGGRVNLHLKNVPFDEGFRTMLAQLNLVAVQKSANVIEIIRASQMPVLSQVFLLKYRFASELKESIAQMLTVKERESTLIAVDANSNSLIVTSTNDMLQKIKSMVDALDIEAPQIAIKARLIEVGMGDILQTGAAISSARSYNNGPNDNGTGRAILGMSNFTQGVLDGQVKNLQTLVNYPSGGIFDFTAVVNNNRLYALLNLLQTDSRTKTISEPMILTGNNKSSKIHVGQNLPVKVLTVTQTSTLQEIKYIPEGVDLDVTPIVSPGSDVISFRIRVGVSELLGFQDGAPIVTERVASTEVSVKSGNTVVIGGLIKDKMTDVDAGIPVLKSIPIIGFFFKNKRKAKEKTELLIFITPELVSRGQRMSGLPELEKR